jgi:hypothetical protein
MHLIKKSICMLFVIFISTSALAEQGDVDMDGSVNLADAVIALKTASGIDTGIQFDIGKSDVNADSVWVLSRRFMAFRLRLV